MGHYFHQLRSLQSSSIPCLRQIPCKACAMHAPTVEWAREGWRWQGSRTFSTISDYVGQAVREWCSSTRLDNITR